MSQLFKHIVGCFLFDFCARNSRNFALRFIFKGNEAMNMYASPTRGCIVRDTLTHNVSTGCSPFVPRRSGGAKQDAGSLVLGIYPTQDAGSVIPTHAKWSTPRGKCPCIGQATVNTKRATHCWH